MQTIPKKEPPSIWYNCPRKRISPKKKGNCQYNPRIARTWNCSHRLEGLGWMSPINIVRNLTTLTNSAFVQNQIRELLRSPLSNSVISGTRLKNARTQTLSSAWRTGVQYRFHVARSTSFYIIEMVEHGRESSYPSSSFRGIGLRLPSVAFGQDGRSG